jgi:hypothetical protein
MRLSRLALFLLISSVVLLAQRTTPADWDVRLDGVNSVKIGMTLAQVKAAIGGKFKEEESGSEGCFFLDSVNQPSFGFMIEDGKLSRINVKKKGPATERGIRVGDTEAMVRKAYGSWLKTEPHAYTGGEGGHYLTFRDGKLGIRFETDGKVVTGFYSGTSDAIQYIEGCE